MDAIDLNSKYAWFKMLKLLIKRVIKQSDRYVTEKCKQMLTGNTLSTFIFYHKTLCLMLKIWNNYI